MRRATKQKFFFLEHHELNEETCSYLKSQVSLLVKRIEQKQMPAEEMIVFFEMLLKMITDVGGLVKDSFLENTNENS